ncbi:MAG TPA: hypothetical protein VK907_09860, partial [Phnomibacter sp.]|nr:hypothetical protein [Phnomibacter sp.]
MKKHLCSLLFTIVPFSIILSQGNVGIGTSTPDKGVLDIVGNTTFSNLSVSNAGGTQGMSLNFSELG